MNLKSPVLDSTKSLSFSYPINNEYPNSVSFSGVHAGFLLAYASSNLIIVLIEGKYISAVLQGHEQTVCTVSFEIRGPHIISCDVSGKCFFWHYQDSIWQNSRIVQLDTPITSASWYTSRREICYTLKDGLYRSSLTDFGITSEKLSNKSSFCTFNYDGTLLASHNKGYTLSIFMFSSNSYLTQVLKHPSQIVTFDFHPSLPSFLTITKDHILRIWRQSILSGFACTAAVKVPLIGFFVKNPFFYSDPSSFGPQKPTTILFVSPQHKFYKLKVEENGLIKNAEDGNPFRNVPISDDFGYRAVYKTNLGTETIIVSQKKISIVSRQKTRELLFHTDIVERTEFAPDNFWLYTLDKSKNLILWPIFNPYQYSREVSDKANIAVWKDSTNLIFQEETETEKLRIYNTLNNKVHDFDFPPIHDLRELYSNNGEIFAITDHNIISQSNTNNPIDEFQQLAISRSFKNQFMVLFSYQKNNQLRTLLCPGMKMIPCSNRTGKIKDLGFVSFILFAVLTDNEIELWSFKDEKVGYQFVNKVYLPGMNRIYSDTSSIGGRLLSHDSRHLFSISNGVTPLLISNNITQVTVSSVGHVAVFWGKNFQVYPSWCITRPDKRSLSLNVGLSQSDELLNIGSLTQDAKYIQKVTVPPSINYMVSPSSYIHPRESNILTIQSTLFHLLECKNIMNLSECSPEQIPAIPNQYAIPSALEFPAEFNNDEYRQLIEQIKNVKEDIDMFGLRYLLAIKENAWPPSYFALWLSYSQSQSQISEHIISFIDANMLSKFYIAASIHQHSILVKIVQHSLINMWISFQKVDNVALLYAALGQLSAIAKLYKSIGDDLRSDFFKHDFKVEKWRKFAIKNAYSSLSHHNLEMSATLFLIAGQVNLCINIISTKMEDPMLGFLVLRLLTNSDYKSKEMQEFMSKVNWNDEIIPILLSNLTKNSTASKLLEKQILEREKSKNITVFGDRRLTLFEIYFNQTKNKDIIGELVTNMNQDGLAPLSKYAYGIVNCPYETFRSIDFPEKASDDSAEEVEVTTSDKSKLGIEEVTIEKVEAFDFGGGLVDDFDDDEWSDDDDDKETEKEKEEEKTEEKVELKASEEGKENLIQKKENKEANIFEQFLLTLTETLCHFYGTKVPEKPDDYAGTFAMRASSINISSRHLSSNKRNILFRQISQFIDECSSLFYESASIPLTPKTLLTLVFKFFHTIVHYGVEHNNSLTNEASQNGKEEELYGAKNELSIEKNSNNNINIEKKNSIGLKEEVLDDIEKDKIKNKDDFIPSLDIKKIIEHRDIEFIESVYNGAVVVATWTYFGQFLAQLLDESIETIFISTDHIPSAQSFFDVDITSPRFPDSIPPLLSRYTQGADQVASFERSRFLIMLLLFESILNTNKKYFEKGRISPKGEEYFMTKMEERHKSMLKTFQFYEIALGSPHLERPSDDNKNVSGTISMIIDNVFKKEVEYLEEIHRRSLNKQGFPGIFRKGKLTVTDKTDVKHPYNNFKAMATMSIKKDKLIAVTDNNQLVKIDFSDPEKPIFKRVEISSNEQKNHQQNLSEIVDVISHPTYDLFICLCSNCGYLFNYDNDPMTIESKITISTSNSNSGTIGSSSQSKITCGEFSPNSAKFAICSNVIDIFNFDLSKSEMTPIMSRRMKGQINCMTWTNTETSLAVSYTNSSINKSTIVVINTLKKYDEKVEVKKEWGIVTSIVANIRKGKLVFGTKNGFVVITEMTRNFEATCIIALNIPITSMKNMQEVVVAGTENGKVIVFSTSKPTKSYQFDINYKMNSVILSDTKIIAAGDSQVFSVWNAL